MFGGTGMWVMIGLFFVVMAIAAVRSAGQRDDFDEQDIDHLDHETHGDSNTH